MKRTYRGTRGFVHRAAASLLLALCGGALFGGCWINDVNPEPYRPVNELGLPKSYADVQFSQRARFATAAQADQVVVTADALTFPAAGNGSMAALAVDDIVVGNHAQGYAGNNPLGFLRKVVSVEAQGGSIVVHTKPAAITDLIESGSFAVTSALKDLRPFGIKDTTFRTPEQLSKEAKQVVDKDPQKAVHVSQAELDAAKAAHKAGRELRLPFGPQGMPPPSTPPTDVLGKDNVGRSVSLPTQATLMKSVLSARVQRPVKAQPGLHPLGFWDDVGDFFSDVAGEVSDFVEDAVGLLQGNISGGVSNYQLVDFGYDVGTFNLAHFDVERTANLGETGAALKYTLSGDVDISKAGFHLKPFLTLQANIEHFSLKTADLVIAGDLSTYVSASAKLKLSVDGVDAKDVLDEEKLAGVAAAEKKREEEKNGEEEEEAKITKEIVEPFYVGEAVIPTVPPIPVTFKFGVDIECSIGANVQIEAEAGVSLQANAMVGTHYDEAGGWQPAWGFNYNTAYDGPNLLTSGEAHIKCGLMPKIMALVADVVGPEAKAGPTLGLTMSYDSSCEGVSSGPPKGEMSIEVKPGFESEIGGKLEIFGFDIGEFTIPLYETEWDGFSRSWDGFSGLGYCSGSDTCGNGQIDGNEQCDWLDVGGRTCESEVGPGSWGLLQCKGDCTLETGGCSAPASCGNGVVDAIGEQCDGQAFAPGSATCAALLGPGSMGTLGCTAQCKADTSGCGPAPSCGDGIVSAPSEQCDGANLAGKSCDVVLGSGYGGTLGCTAGCTWDTSGCTPPPSCGSGQIEPGSNEECDGANLGGATCASALGIAGATGTLGCTSLCKLDKSGCQAPAVCGNGKRDLGEACDGADFGGLTCAGIFGGFAPGSLACTANCTTIDTLACLLPSFCGDGVKNGAEACDGADLGGATCGAGATGTVTCKPDCTLDTSSCQSGPACGDGVKNGSEQCDGADVGGATCAALLGASFSGTVGCQASCVYDTSSCGYKGQTGAATALCTSQYANITFQSATSIRGTWQYNPGGPFVSLPAPGYPCQAFLYDSAVRPSMTSTNWVGAPNAQSIVFSQASTISATNFTQAQFRYFRTLVFLPANANFSSLKLSVSGVDDSAFVELWNPDYPNGISPAGAGTSDPSVGACVGNGARDFDFTSYVKKGAVNAFLLVQADLNPMTSALGGADILIDGAPMATFDCSTATE